MRTPHQALISRLIAAITNPASAATGSSSWQLVFISLAVVIMLLEIIHGWRLGLIRQLVRVIAIVVAYSCGFFAANATIPIMRSYLKLPDPILAALGGAILAFILFAAINLIGAFLLKKTAQQPSRVIRLIWGFSGALLGILLGVFTLWITFTGIRMVGSVAQARLHSQNPPAVGLPPNEAIAPAASVAPAGPLMTMLSDMKSALEAGHIGEAVRAVDPLPPALYRGLEKAGEVASSPECAERFLSFPGAREISDHPRVIALRNDRQVMELIGNRQFLELMKNQHLIDAMNDPSLQARIKKFDLERALDYALEKR
jgi:Colicin V production protein